MSSRAAKRNTQGGKAFKAKAKGGVSYRATAALEAANEMLDVILARENNYKGMTSEAAMDAGRALLEIQVGRITRKFGNGRFEVFCQDNKVRNCALRGLLRRKGQCFVDIGSLIVISLSEPLEEVDDSDSEGNFGGGKARAGADFRAQAGQGYIVGIFDDRTESKLRKTRINPRLFKVDDGIEGEIDDMFDRSVAEEKEEDEEKKTQKKTKKDRKGDGDDSDDELDIDAI